MDSASANGVVVNVKALLPQSSPPCLGGVAAASADGVVAKENQILLRPDGLFLYTRQISSISVAAILGIESDSPMNRAKPNHPLARPARNLRPNSRPYLQTFRTNLRKTLTPAEATLWGYLKASRLDGRKFRRQHSVVDYILDFYCPSERLAVELDGEVHRNDPALVYDYERKIFLQRYGIKVIRFENFLVFDEIEFVLAKIKSFFGWWEETE